MRIRLCVSFRLRVLVALSVQERLLLALLVGFNLLMSGWAVVMMAFAGRYGVPASLVYFDVNNMKQINDLYGHAAGDATLMQVARVLVESVRATDVVGRLGGDELGVLLVQTDKALAEHKAAELAALVDKQSISWHGRKLPVSVAFGTYAFLGGENASAVLDAADREMYRRKTGRDRDV